jgi:hypothetical protein
MEWLDHGTLLAMESACAGSRDAKSSSDLIMLAADATEPMLPKMGVL